MLVLVVHVAFQVNGTSYNIGDLVAAPDVAAVQANPLLFRYCTWAVHDNV
jgi:hypothetical protein